MFGGKRFIPIAGLLVLTTGSMFAGAIPTDGSWEEFLFGTPGTFAGACGGGCVATTDPVADQSVDSPWTFSGAATLDVLDLFIAGDQFDVFDNGVDLGDTSVPTNTGYAACSNDIGCALADANYSLGVYDLGAGDHSITIEVVQNAAGQDGGAAALSVTAAAAPEPGTLALLGAGLGALYLRRRRKA